MMRTLFTGNVFKYSDSMTISIFKAKYYLFIANVLMTCYIVLSCYTLTADNDNDSFRVYKIASIMLATFIYSLVYRALIFYKHGNATDIVSSSLFSSFMLGLTQFELLLNTYPYISDQIALEKLTLLIMIGCSIITMTHYDDIYYTIFVFHIEIGIFVQCNGCQDSYLYYSILIFNIILLYIKLSQKSKNDNLENYYKSYRMSMANNND
jgi:hypothetical protein